jgi:hypothetical protein
VIVGYASLSATNDQAVIWDSTRGMRNLKRALTSEHGLGTALAGWELRNAMDISADGAAIVGYGNDPDGFQQAFLVLLPEPGIAGLAMGFACVLARRGRRRC